MAIQFRRGSPPDNYVLLDGEPGWDSVDKVFKMGDGSTAWTDLPAIGASELANLHNLSILFENGLA